MESGPPPPIEEDYKFLAEIEVGGKIEPIPCKIYLPKTVMDEPQVYLFPKFARMSYMLGGGNKNIGGALGNDTENKVEFQLENTHFSGGSSRNWGDSRLEEGYTKLYPENIIIKHRFFDEEEREETKLYFHLTPCSLLSPFDFRVPSYTGEVTLEPGERLSFELSEGFKVTFGNHYKWMKQDMNSQLSVRELYCDSVIEGAIDETNVWSYISLLDKFLMLSSYAEDQTVVTLKVDITNRDRRIEIFRMNRIIPELDSRHSFRHYNIYENQIEDFLNTSWKTWGTSKYEKLIQRALGTDVFSKRRSMDAEFLALFSAIETLLLIYRKENTLEQVINDEKEWKNVKQQLRKTLKNSSYLEEPLKRDLIYQNLDGLNRISLQHTLSHLVENTPLSFNDLWPFSSTQYKYSLTTIRNQLVHGHGYRDSVSNSFPTALDHLETYYDRLLIYTLGWEFQKANIGPRKLKSPSEVDDWENSITDMEIRESE